MKVAFIHNEKKIGTGANYINDLMSSKLKEDGVIMKNFYPRASLVTPNHLSGLKNILFFFSLLEKRNDIFKYDMIQGTTYTPLPFLAYPIPVISHFGSTNRGFLQATPRAGMIEKGPKEVWYELRKAGAIKELNLKTRRPLRDIAEIEEYVARRADAVIATSKKVKQELQEMGVDEEKIHLIHNAIEDYWFGSDKYPIIEEPRIVFLGRIGAGAFDLKLKGFDRLIHLFDSFTDTKKITVCMTTNKPLMSWMLNSIPNHALFANIKKDKIPAILQPLRGSVLFISSRYEGFSLSLIEGMSQGLIPIMYDVGVAAEIIVNGKNGFLVSSQKEAIEKAKLLLTNKTLRKKCTEGAEKTAELFRSDVITKKLIAVYEKIHQENQ